MIKRFFTLCLLGVMSSFVYATHFAGLELNAECLNGCTYRIHHKAYYECAGAAATTPPNPTPLPNVVLGGTPFGCNFSAQAIGSWVFVHHLEITPICPSMASLTTCVNPNGTIYGISEGYYYIDYDICNNGVPSTCTTMDISYSSCCRNGSITSGADNDGLFLSIRVPIDSGACNNSPVFNQSPELMICSGTSTIMDHSAFDADGDSLVYSLTTCFENPGIASNYDPGYSPQNFLGPTWTTSINPITGMLSIIPNPGNPAVGIVCITVDEYRNGVNIGSITRDFQVLVTSCTSTTQVSAGSMQNLTGATLTGPNTIQVCAGVPVSFNFDATDPNPQDSISITSNLSALFGNSSDTLSGGNPANYTASFTPGVQHIGGTYQLDLLIEDNQCPISSSVVETITIHVVGNCLTYQTTPSSCTANTGAIDITLLNATPPIQYLWSTGDTTEDISGLASGTYWVTATDSSGQTYTDTIIVDAADIIITDSVTVAGCDANDGSIQVSASGGTAPYSYLWSNGATTSNISGLGAGGYTVYITDALGCVKHKTYILNQPTACHVEIKGKAYLDQNNNCIFDAGDYPLVNSYINFSPGGALLTDTNGDYTFLADTGTITITYTNQAHPAAACGAGNTQVLTFNSYDDDTMGVDFPIDTIAIADLKVDIVAVGNLVSGFNHNYYVSYRNIGTIPMSGTVTFTHDDSVTYLSSAPAGAYTAATKTVSWSFTNLAPGQIMSNIVNATIPATVPLGTPISATAVINPITGDATPPNNTFTWMDTTALAVDPNDKQVMPAGIGAPGFIQTKDSVLNYTVRFQNTGNFPATFVIIEDSIDENLDITSISMGAASHPYTVFIDDDQKLVITFDNINLPDSLSDPLGSQGFVQFAIKQNPNLPIGTEITNQASIIFDFNAPIITNQVINTIFDYPVVSMVNPNDTLCQNDMVTVAVTEASISPYTYQWQPLNQSQTTPDSVNSAAVTVSDFYTVIVTDAFGFSDTATQYIHVIENPVSNFSFQSNVGTVDFTDLSQHASEWQWDFGDANFSNDQNPQHVYTANGTYNVTLITTNDCSKDTSTQVVEIGSVSISDHPFVSSVSIAPNPFSESVQISFRNPSQAPVELKLMDARGRVIIHRQPERTESFVIQNQGLTPGIYMIELIGPERFVGKVMVR